MKVVGESCVIVTDELIRLAPPLSVRVRLAVVKVEGSIGSENVTSIEPTGPLCGLETVESEATAGGVAVVGL